MSSEPLAGLQIGPGDAVAIAVSDQLPADTAERLASQIAERLDRLSAPTSQRTWIVATSGDDEQAARVVATIETHAAGAGVLVHDPRELDELIFERRLPGQRRGGVYLNALWQSASVRIACGEPLELVNGLSAWFNPVDRLRAADLQADLLMRA